MVLRLAWVLAVLLVASTANAGPKHRVTVLDFEGPGRLADAAQRVVVNALGDRYDMVSAKRWEAANMTACGPRQWMTAAKTSGVDFVVEGWVDPEGGRTHEMTVAVREASTGREIDTIAVKISDTGAVSDDQTRRLARDLDDLLDVDESDAVQSEPETPRVLPGPATAAGSYPSDEPVIEVLLTGGFFSHREGAVVWADGTVQFFGGLCARRGKLTPSRVATLIDALRRDGFFEPRRAAQRDCLDGFDVDVEVRSGDRRAAAHESLCGDAETVTARAYDRVWSELGSNSCAAK